jgi:hypothetical protein
MPRTSFVLSFLGLLVLGCTTAHAQVFRAYVASYGSDANPCTVTQPCRLIPAALNAAVDGGEIWILDSANFNAGTVNITKSINILAVPGQVGSIVSTASAPAITISAANAKVRLRNLSIVDNANNHGTDGIVMTAGISLTVDDCTFRVQGDAVSVSGAGIDAVVMNSRVLGANNGVKMSNGASGAVTHTNFADIMTFATWAYATVSSTTSLTVSDSTFNRVHAAGVALSEIDGPLTQLALTRSTVSNSDIGVGAQGAGSKVTVGQNTFANVGTALYNTLTGKLESFGNNMGAHNSANASGTITTVSPF